MSTVIYRPSSSDQTAFLDYLIFFQLKQQYDNVLRLRHLWKTSLVSDIRYNSHIETATSYALQNTDGNEPSVPTLTWIEPRLEETAVNVFDSLQDSETDDDASNSDSASGEEDNVERVLLAELLEDGEVDDAKGGDLPTALPLEVRRLSWNPPVSLLLRYLTHY